MNLFGLIATLFVCITIAASVYIVCKQGVTIYRVHEDIVNATQTPAPAPAVPEELKKRNDKDDAIKAMDAVVKAANELMGIGVVEEEENN